MARDHTTGENVEPHVTRMGEAASRNPGAAVFAVGRCWNPAIDLTSISRELEQHDIVLAEFEQTQLPMLQKDSEGSKESVMFPH